jgi:hypothetical protein
MQSESQTGSEVSVVSLSKSSQAKHTSEGIPILERYKLPDGREVELVPKDVNHKTLACPDCEVALEYDEHEDAVCPECGFMGE